MCTRSSVFPWLLYAVALSASGCDAIFGDGYEVRITSDSEEYSASTSTSVSMTVDNRSDNVVYYLCFGEGSIERVIDGEVAGTFGFGNCDCLCPNPIEPGESETREYRLYQEMVDWIYDHPNPEDVTYRFRFVLYEDAEFDKELDVEDQRSNIFRFELPIDPLVSQQ